MVQIFIKTAENGNADEWSIIELQGDLEVDNGESLANKFMADLHFNKDGTPILVIGHHVMHGKVINLEKPMVLLQKVRKTFQNKVNSLNDSAEMEIEEEKMVHDDDSSKMKTEYTIKAVIKRKILFNKRPRPIVFI